MKCKYCGTKLGKGIEVCPKCGRENKNFFQGKNKIIIIAVVAVLVVAGTVGGIFALTGSSQEMEVKLMDEDSGEYMLVNAPSDIEFDIKLEKGAAKDIKVKDLKGDVVPVSVEGSGKTVKIHAPKGGYVKGEIYTVDLSDHGSFSNQEFKGAKKLTIIIERRNTTDIEYRDGVKELKAKDATLKGERIRLDGNYKNGQVIVVDADKDGTQETYKLKDVKKSQGGTTAAYIEPTADEVYEKLDVFYYDDVDLSKADIDEKIVGEMLETSGVIEIFTDDVYADSDDVEYEAEFDKEKNFKITVKDPKKKSRQLVIKFGIEDKILFKCTKKTAVLDNTLTVSGDIDLTIKGSKEKEKEESILKAIDTYVADPDEKLTSTDYENVVVPVKISVVGPIAVYVDLGAKAEFKASAKFHAGIDTELSFNQGIVYDLKKQKVNKMYAGLDGNVESKLMVEGTLDAYAGLYLEAGATAASVIKLGIRGDGGPYVDGKGCFVVESDLKDVKTDGYYKLDIGLKTTTNAIVDLPLLKEKTFEVDSSKKSLVKFNHYLALEDVSLKESYYKSQGGIHIGDLEASYYDKVESEEISKEIDSYTLSIDGKEATVESGVVQNDLSIGKHTFKLEWEEDGQKFSEERKVEIKEFDPWGHFGQYNLFNMTYGEIENRYGTFTYLGGGEGAEWYQPKNLNIEVGFSWDDIIGNEDYQNAVCVVVGGAFKDLFGLNEEMSFEELSRELNLDTNFCYSVETEDWYGEYRGNRLFIYGSSNYCSPSTFATIMK